MWRVRATRPGIWLGVVFAIFAGFLLGNWQSLKSRAADLSPSSKVALRFPEADLERPVAVKAAVPAPMILGDKDLALFSPEPMLPETRRHPSPPLQPQPAEVTASLQADEAAPRRVVPVALPAAARREAKVVTASAVRPALRAEATKAEADGISRRGSRPGFLLNDAQIASIRSRLRLTPDQEQMWPAVEAALRNIAYAKAQSARRHSDDRGTEVASLDPDSAAVQGLKSAAVPLIMSFSEEQRSEVRNLAHVMGLDKLASEF
ncbi:MAG TPA: hypothetical protein VGG11_05030 [Xanthobacteraceae bacterium]|jgi:hypothetical protein